jgi:hypothetical protein
MPRLLLVIGLGLCVRVLATANGEPAQAPLPRIIPIAELVKQLGSEDFAEREAATKRLSALVLDPPHELLAAMKSDNQEVRDRATKAAQVMRSNLVATRLPRGRRFAECGQVDLFVAATTVWDLKPEDPRLWEPAQDLGRRLIEKAEMSREPQCPSSFKDFDTYKRLTPPLFTRVNEDYERPDPHPKLYINEAIHAAGVYGATGMINNLIVSRGRVYTKRSIQASVVFANGDVTARNGLIHGIVICDGDVTLTDSQISVGLIVARGNISSKFGADRAVLIAGGTVTLGKPREGVAEGRQNTIKEKETNPLGYITFFELSTVGVEVSVVDKAVKVAAVEKGKPFADASVWAGDIITEVNGKKPDSPESLRRLLRDALAIGDATVKLQRGDKTETVKVSLPE